MTALSVIAAISQKTETRPTAFLHNGTGTRFYELKYERVCVLIGPLEFRDREREIILLFFYSSSL